MRHVLHQNESQAFQARQSEHSTEKRYIVRTEEAEIILKSTITKYEKMLRRLENFSFIVTIKSK